MDQWSEVMGACRHSMYSAHMTGRNWEVLVQLAIFLPIQAILHPHHVGQPHNTIRILFVLTAPKVRRRGIAKITVYTKGASPYPQQKRAHPNPNS